MFRHNNDNYKKWFDVAYKEPNAKDIYLPEQQRREEAAMTKKERKKLKEERTESVSNLALNDSDMATTIGQSIDCKKFEEIYEFHNFKSILIGDEDSCKTELMSKYFKKPVEDLPKTDNGLYADAT